MFDRPDSGERAVLVHLDLQQEQEREDLQEFQDLAISAGVDPVAIVTGSRRTPEPKYFVGTGKAEEIREVAGQTDAEVILVNHALTPGQERNLERLVKCRVLDRTGLILDIFAQRARSHEGKLQVELAQLRHLSTRLIRGWTHLERQKGGIGLRGPGETQLESDRRLIGDRIKQLNRRLEKVDRQREQGRRSRNRADIATVALVGYTNAGKSTLFNRLTAATVFAADQLFATLDPTMRRLELGDGTAAVLADTVGFIRHLPHDLVAAFRSTLLETREADLLLHVVDASDPERADKKLEVEQVLAEIGAERVPRLEVYNKVDRIQDGEPRVEFGDDGTPLRVHLSAVTGAGLDALPLAIGRALRGDLVRRELRLPPTAGKLRAQLYQLGTVRSESIAPEGHWLLEVEIQRQNLERLEKEAGETCF